MARLILFAVLAALVITIIVFSGRILLLLATLSVFPSFLDHSLKPSPIISAPTVQHAASSRIEAASQASTILINGAERMRPAWETIQPKSKAECLQASGGALNPVFVRCHYGYQESVTYDSKGNRKILQERSIPSTVP